MSEAEAVKLAKQVLGRMSDGWGNIMGDLAALAQRAPMSMRWRAKRARRECMAGNSAAALVWLRQLAEVRP